jgi:hypothetical protein
VDARHDHAGTLQFANDTLIAPTWIFACESQDPGSNVTANRRASWSPIVPRPLCHQTPVPTQQRGRSDEKRRLPDPRQRPSRSRQEPPTEISAAQRDDADRYLL